MADARTSSTTYEPLVLAGWLPPSELGANSRVYYMTKWRLRDRVYLDVWLAVYQSDWPQDAHQGEGRKRRIRITEHRQRFLDPDNLVASVKCLLDGLKRANVLVDDSAKWLELEVRQEKCKRAEQRTVIEMEDV